MIHPHIDKKRAVPFWAILGAPLIGVPLMVALLALTAPAGVEEEVEVGAGITTEQIDIQSVDQTVPVGIEESAALRTT